MRSVDPFEIENETELLYEKWKKEVTDDNYVAPDEYMYLNASDKWKDYVDKEKQMIEDALKEGWIIN